MNNNFSSQIPVFPLSGVIYFPKSNLPLNIFEQRYTAVRLPLFAIVDKMSLSIN